MLAYDDGRRGRVRTTSGIIGGHPSKVDGWQANLGNRVERGLTGPEIKAAGETRRSIRDHRG